MSGIERLIGVMAQLRHPETGCPWDREQSFATIAPYTIEEAYEVADAIERGDTPLLREELGDLLFQVVFHGRMAEEAGLFDFDGIAQGIADKMIRRHPHVFGGADARSADGQSLAWEAMKAAERKAKVATSGALDGVTSGLPALTRAAKIQARAARVGFDWEAPIQVLDKIAEETQEVAEAIGFGDKGKIEEEIGDLLFAVTNLARKLGLDPEAALRRGTSKFERRFRGMEALLAAAGEKMEGQGIEALEELWRRVKTQE